MTENDPIIIKMNIAHYEAVMKITRDDRKRWCIDRLIAQATRDLDIVLAGRQYG